MFDVMTVTTASQLNEVPTSELVAAYNRLTGKNTKKFSTRSKGIEQTFRAIAEARKSEKAPKSQRKAKAGQRTGRLTFRDEDERGRAHRIGIEDLNKIYDLKELASGDWIVFAATGVTRGFMLDGVEEIDGARVTQTTIMTSWDKVVRTIETQSPI